MIKECVFDFCFFFEKYERFFVIEIGDDFRGVFVIEVLLMIQVFDRFIILNKYVIELFENVLVFERDFFCVVLFFVVQISGGFEVQIVEVVLELQNCVMNLLVLFEGVLGVFEGWEYVVVVVRLRIKCDKI